MATVRTKIGDFARGNFQIADRHSIQRSKVPFGCGKNDKCRKVMFPSGYSNMGADAVAISPDNYVLICVFWKKLITLWNLESLTLLTPMRCQDDIQTIECVSSDTNVDQLLIATAHVLLKCDHRTEHSLLRSRRWRKPTFQQVEWKPTFQQVDDVASFPTSTTARSGPEYPAWRIDMEVSFQSIKIVHYDTHVALSFCFFKLKVETTLILPPQKLEE